MTCKDTIFSKIYSKLHPDKEPPYYCYYSISTILKKPIRKWFSALVSHKNGS